MTWGRSIQLSYNLLALATRSTVDGIRTRTGGYEPRRPFLLFTMSAALLASCSTPAAKAEVVTVRVPVAIQPILPSQVPTPPSPLGPRPPSLSAAADTLLSKWCEAVGYILRADPLLKISAGGKAGELARYPECEGR